MTERLNNNNDARCSVLEFPLLKKRSVGMCECVFALPDSWGERPVGTGATQSNPLKTEAA